ncbi:MAG TPA: hypothetical protein VGQ83_28980 [Polyangia bacterium]|jgi:hypothetical protein
MRRALVSTLAAALLASLAYAGAADLPRLFPREADVTVAEAGLCRLDLPAEVLAACRPDLADLRIFDPTGAEVPFLVDSGAPAAPAGVRQRYPAAILEARRSQTPHGDAPPITTEAFELAVPAVAPEGGVWDLVVTTARPEFVRTVRVSVPLHAELLTGATIFRLPASGREKTRLTLPPVTPSTRLTVTLAAEDINPLRPAFAFESARAFEGDRRAVVPLAVLASQQAGGRTIVDLARPRGLVPTVLRLTTATEAFDRRALVRDEGPNAGAEPLGEAALFRVGTRGVMIAELELPLRGARGDRLRVAITDGDSPPLRDLAFAAVVVRPALVFALAPAAGGGPAGVLRFGGGRAYRPVYDLAGLAAQGATGERARAALRLYDPTQLGAARLGPARANPLFDAAPALAFAMRPGAAVDPRRYRHHRSITVARSPEGLVKLRLAPADLAVIRADLADVRVVDAERRQWPYLLEAEAAWEWVDLGVAPPARAPGVSRFKLTLPVAPLRLDQIVLATDAPFFDRSYRLLTTSADGAETHVAAGRLVRRAEDARAVVVAFAPQRVSTLTLEIADGDDAPLPLRSVRGRAAAAELYLAAPAGTYELLLGDPDDAPPRYEISRVRDVVLAVAAGEARPGRLEPNPAYTVRARLSQGGGPAQLALWAVLGVAVLALAILTLRLARRDTPAEPPSAGAPPAAGPPPPSAPPPAAPPPVTTGGTPPPAAA